MRSVPSVMDGLKPTQRKVFGETGEMVGKRETGTESPNSTHLVRLECVKLEEV